MQISSARSFPDYIPHFPGSLLHKSVIWWRLALIALGGLLVRRQLFWLHRSGGKCPDQRTHKTPRSRISDFSELHRNSQLPSTQGPPNLRLCPTATTEKIGYLNAQGVRDFNDSARAQAIACAFVLLNLLRSHSKPFTKFALAQATKRSKPPQVFADDFVGRPGPSINRLHGPSPGWMSAAIGRR
jgi:hypothetical protein